MIKCGSLQNLDASSRPLSASTCVLNCVKSAAETYPTVHNDLAGLMAFGICEIFLENIQLQNSIFLGYKLELLLKQCYQGLV
jgi:hypothetical protein